jgi:cation transport ATPase
MVGSGTLQETRRSTPDSFCAQVADTEDRNNFAKCSYGPHDRNRPRTGARPIRRSQNVRHSPEPWSACRALGGDVSRQVVVELGSNNSGSVLIKVLIKRCPTMARLHRPFLPRLEVHSRHPWHGVFVYGDLVFIRSARGDLADRKPGMMTLISLATIVAFWTSLAGNLPFAPAAHLK